MIYEGGSIQFSEYFETMHFHESHSSGILDQAIPLTEVNQVVKAIKNNKSSVSDGIVGELIKYGGKPKCKMFLTLIQFGKVTMFLLIEGRVLQLAYLRKGVGKIQVIIEI